VTGEPSPALILRPRRASPSDVRWAQRVDDLQFDALTRVRATAEKWAASLAAILGVAGTVLLVKGRADITTLETGYQVLVAVVIFAALVVAVVATFYAALAAQGTPKDVNWPTGQKLRRWEREQALSAISRLKTSRVLSIIAIGLVVLAVGLTWFGEARPASATPATVLVLRKAAEPLCGELVAGKTAGAVRLSPKNSSAVTLVAMDIESVVPVSACPPPKAQR
jgi:hypothetical protein